MAENEGADDATETEETEFHEGQSEYKELDDIKLTPTGREADVEEDEYEESEEDAGESNESEDGEDEEESDEGKDPGKDYKELQKVYGESQEEVKSLRELASAFEEFGGVEKALGALKFIQNDPEFSALATKKSRGEIEGVDESKMSPQAKEAIELMRKVTRQEVAVLLKIHDDKIDKRFVDTVEPEIAAAREVRIDKMIGQMSDKYGSEWMEQLKSMEKLGDTLDPKVSKAPKFGDLEDIYFKSLRLDGKFDAFLVKRGNKVVKTRKSKSINRPSSTDTMAKEAAKPKTMQEAAVIAERKLGYK